MDDRPSVLLAFVDLRGSEPLQAAAKALRSYNPGSPVICLDTPETTKIESHAREIDRWLTIGAGAESRLRSLWKLRQLRPEVVCVLYGSDFPHAHLKLELLAALIGGEELLGSFAPNFSRLRRMSRPGLWARIAGKLGLLFVRGGAAAILSLVVGVVLLFAGLLAKPGERLGAPAAGNPQEKVENPES
jgi:hypothetical protein